MVRILRTFAPVLMVSFLSMFAAGQENDSSDTTVVFPKGLADTTTLTFKDTDIRDVFRALANQHRLNVYVDNSVSKRVTLSLREISVLGAMQFICEQNMLDLLVEGSIVRVSPRALPVVEPPAPKIPLVSFRDDRLTVHLKGDNLEATILEIQKTSGRNILIQSGTSGTLTGTLTNIPFDIGFTQLLNNNGFAVQQKEGIFLVSRLDFFVGSQPRERKSIAGPYWISVNDSVVTIDVTKAPIDRVLSDIFRQMKTDIVFYNDVTGTVTAKAGDLSPSRALDLILRNTPFTFRESNGVFFVGQKDNASLETTRLFRLKYVRAEQALSMIPQSMTDAAMMKLSKEHNGIIAIGSGDIIARAEEFLSKLDQPVPQVLLEAVVVDFDRSKGLNLGVDAGRRTQSDTTRITQSYIPGLDMILDGVDVARRLGEFGLKNVGPLPSDFYLRLQALEQQGVVNIRSRPLLATLNGHQASLSIGTTQYFILRTTTPYRDPNQVILQESQTFTQIDADVKLEITPYVGAEGLITVEIKPDFKTPIGNLNPDTPPTLNRRAMSSTIIMKEGETIVLGGLIQETDSELRSQTPILGSIPLLGYLFSSTSTTKTKSELLIYVTPHVSYGEAFKVADLSTENR